MNPESLAPPIGYAHAVVTAPGRLVFLGGQTSQDEEGVVRGEALVEQFDLALGNVVEALAAAGGRPEHLVSLLVYVTDIDAYRRALRDLGETYRRHFGRHFPAMALLEVASLLDAAAQIELVGTAVVPE